MGIELLLSLTTNFLLSVDWAQRFGTHKFGELINYKTKIYFFNRLAFPNKDRKLLRGLNEAFRENSVNISDGRAFRFEIWPLRHR